MGSVFYNDGSTILRATRYYNDNGVIKNEDNIDIYFNNGQEIIKMPQKGSLLLNLTPHYTFAYYTTRGANFMLTSDVNLKSMNSDYWFCNERDCNKTYDRPNGDRDLSVNPYQGIWLFGKVWNQFNFTLPEPLFNGTTEATISMTFGNTSHNNDGYFWFLDNNTQWGIQGHWSPFIYRFRNNTGTGQFQLPQSYGEAGVHNITVTFSGRVVKVYWNGAKVAENSGINRDQGVCSRIWLNGYLNHSGTFCNMSVYSMRVWKTCLTDDEVATAFKFDAGYIS